jgi:hypothetical protein
MKKGKTIPMAALTFHNRDRDVGIALNGAQGEWLSSRMPDLSVRNRDSITFDTLRQDFLQKVPADFNLFWNSAAMQTLRENGLILL